MGATDPVRRRRWASWTAPTVARAQGASTGPALRALGINVDFAPVADVPGDDRIVHVPAGPDVVVQRGPHRRPVERVRVGARVEGRHPVDEALPGHRLRDPRTRTPRWSRIRRLARARLAPGLRPYRTAIAQHIPLIMLSNATYTAYDATHAAGWSRAIARDAAAP